MKVRITRTTVADGGVVRAGEVREISDADARTLIALGKAVLIEAGEPEEVPPTVIAKIEQAIKRGRKPGKVRHE